MQPSSENDNVTLYALQQAVLDLRVQGSGDITAFGQVDLLVAEMAGSGDVDASELVAKSAKLSMVGSGDIDAYVSDSVKARVMGSGDIVIRGNPPIRDHRLPAQATSSSRRSNAPAGSDCYRTPAEHPLCTDH